MKYLNFWPNTCYNLLTKFPTAITHFYKQKPKGISCIRICTMWYMPKLCAYAQNIHTHMHYVLSTVCICAAKLSRQKAITFYMFHIFYTMGDVLRAIVYDYKTNKLCTLVENKQRFTLKITWVAKTKHFIYPPIIIVHYD